ncbi:MAG: DUF362 domain-containing protein [Prevotellaceae bacterium]|jgi:uncharacterized protein (DUF362 family)|nr:DUF362 domain-containing protein [Prevotellaceae bacterium]
MDRRKFFRITSATGAGIAAGAFSGKAFAAVFPTITPQQPQKPATNIGDILKFPRTPSSMPGRYPGKVVKVYNLDSVVNDTPMESVAYNMLEKSMLQLTGEENLTEAWRQFVSPDEVIGLKVNPIGEALLSTSHAVVQSVIKQMEEAGIPRKNIVIWDRRGEQLEEAGFTPENYPDIRILSTEYKENGSYYGTDGKLLSEHQIDPEWYYMADCEQEYDAYTLPYMVNQGKYSYFSKICTQVVDKIINIPIMKNAGASVTLCLKNLGFGAITNTGRLHRELWHDTCAQVCAFPPIRDKVVLNIADGLRGCYDGGPGANPQFLCEYHTLLVGTDAVAVDRIGHEIIIGRRIAEGRQQEDSPKGITQLLMAQEYGLGVADRDKIDLIET